MKWELAFLPEAAKDLKNLSGNQRIIVAKALDKVLQNPLPSSNGGYGKSLGNQHGSSLSGFLKIKLRGLGIRIVYKLVRTNGKMLVVVIGARADQEVYEAAQHRIEKYHL